MYEQYTCLKLNPTLALNERREDNTRNIESILFQMLFPPYIINIVAYEQVTIDVSAVNLVDFHGYSLAVWASYFFMVLVQTGFVRTDF